MTLQSVQRKDISFSPDPSRVILRFFLPGDRRKVESVIRRIQSLDDEHVRDQLRQVKHTFSHRHRNTEQQFLTHYRKIAAEYDVDSDLSEEKALLLGAYFSHEYSIESAALFNPSMVVHPDQTGLAEEDTRIVLSFRATGEGHLSTIEFRSGKLDRDNNISMDKDHQYADLPNLTLQKDLEKKRFSRKMRVAGVIDDTIESALQNLPEVFSAAALINELRGLRQSNGDLPAIPAAVRLARAHNTRVFSEETNLSERVIHPVLPEESNGLEDARFVRFVTDDGAAEYYATYTAFDGSEILPMLLHTTDFRHFDTIPMTGSAVRDKGMALFPRKIHGKYAMISRIDGENLYIMYSDSVDIWQDAELLRKPQYPWEAIQLGNCGSPIETDEGGLLITHGVGPMRQYRIGMLLLDRNDPSEVIGSTAKPLLEPQSDEREGYVPNVVYSCGGIVHNDELVLPFAKSDSSCGIVTVKLEELLSELKP